MLVVISLSLSLSEVAVFIWLGSTGFLGDCNTKTLLVGGSCCRRTLGGVHAQKTLFIKVGTASWALVVLVITKDATMNYNDQLKEKLASSNTSTMN